MDLSKKLERTRKQQERAKRQRIVEMHPRVKRLPDDAIVDCTGIKWGKVSLKHIFSMYGKPAEGMPERIHCKNGARWRFKRRKLDVGPYHNEVEYFCWSHLMSRGLYGSMEEEDYTRRWLIRLRENGKID